MPARRFYECWWTCHNCQNSCRPPDYRYVSMSDWDSTDSTVMPPFFLSVLCMGIQFSYVVGLDWLHHVVIRSFLCAVWNSLLSLSFSLLVSVCLPKFSVLIFSIYAWHSFAVGVSWHAQHLYSHEVGHGDACMPYGPCTRRSRLLTLC